MRPAGRVLGVVLGGYGGRGRLLRLGLILGILLISQFWTLANDVYDARQAKRLFGFIGGGASLGGATGAAITASRGERVGTVNLLLVSAARDARLRSGWSSGSSGARSRSGSRAPSSRQRALAAARRFRCCCSRGICNSSHRDRLRRDGRRHHRAAAQHGREREPRSTETDGITQFLAQVTVYLSLIGFVDPGRHDQPYSQAAGHRVRAAHPARGPRHVGRS